MAGRTKTATPTGAAGEGLENMRPVREFLFTRRAPERNSWGAEFFEP